MLRVLGWVAHFQQDKNSSKIKTVAKCPAYYGVLLFLGKTLNSLDFLLQEDFSLCSNVKIINALFSFIAFITMARSTLLVFIRPIYRPKDAREMTEPYFMVFLDLLNN